MSRRRTEARTYTIDIPAGVDDVPVGIQHMAAKDFPVMRTVDTGSWLTLAEQRKGYGKEMRTAVLHLAFEELGAYLPSPLNEVSRTPDEVSRATAKS